MTDIHCSTCGSQFSLVSDEMEKSQAETLGTLGQFELLERIGVGGFATVWRARDQELQRTVAIKIPRKGQLTATDAESFLREARAVAQIQHPNVVSVHEVGRREDVYYIVTDLVSGSTLVDWRLSRKPTAHEAVALCVKLADGLHHAHQSGVVHRDLKPHNVMVDDQDEPHIMDFGLAKRDVGETTVTLDGIVLGTPAYMSPEQARGEGHLADRRTDIYALGVVLYELLTGGLPFRGNSRSLIDQVIHDLPPSPRKLNESLPRDLETICLKCLEKDPQSRYASAAELAAELRRYLRGEPLVARPLGRAARFVRWSRRKPALAALCATLATLLLLIAVAGPLVALRERTLRQRADQESRRANAGEERAKRQEREARDQLYFADMNLVAQSWEMNNLLRMRHLLERHLPQPGQRDLRQFEWYYYWRLCHSELAILRHPRPVSSAVFSPDGDILAVSDHGSTVSLYDWRQGRVTNVLRGHADSVRALAFSPDGKMLASSSQDTTVRLWQLPEGQELAVLEGHSGDVTSLAFSADGETLASAAMKDAAVRLWDVASRQTLAILNEHDDGVETVAFSPAGKILATAGRDRTVILWDYASGKPMARLQGHHACIFSIAFSHDGTELASACYDGSIKLWDVATGRERLTLRGHTDGVTAVAYSPDGLTLASASIDHAVGLWDVATGELRATLVGHTGGVLGVTFAPDGSQLASCGGGRVLLWDTTSGQRCGELSAHTSAVWSVAFAPDGKTLASASHDETIILWDRVRAVPIKTLRGHGNVIQSVAFSPDGNRLIASGIAGTLQFYRADPIELSSR